MTGRGLNTREMAEQLRKDMKTVDTYRTRIKEKLNLESTSELLQLAIRWNQDHQRGRGSGNTTAQWRAAPSSANAS
jgi:hypothetical protein